MAATFDTLRQSADSLKFRPHSEKGVPTHGISKVFFWNCTTRYHFFSAERGSAALEAENNVSVEKKNQHSELLHKFDFCNCIWNCGTFCVYTTAQQKLPAEDNDKHTSHIRHHLTLLDRGCTAVCLFRFCRNVYRFQSLRDGQAEFWPICFNVLTFNV